MIQEAEMDKMTEEKRIKLGQICNKLATILFVLFFIDTCVIITFDIKLYLIITAVIVILFAICCIIAHRCLKDYKPQ